MNRNRDGCSGDAKATATQGGCRRDDDGPAPKEITVVGSGMTSAAAIMRPLILAAAICAAAKDGAAAPAPGAGAPSGHRLTLTPRADSHTRHRRSTGDGGGTFGMVATAGFDLSATAIEVCGTSAARCSTFGRDIPGWRAGDRVPDAAVDGGPRRYWWGHDGNSTLNLITHGADDRVFGSMVDGSSLLIYSFGYDAEGATLVHATHTDQFTELPPHGHDHDEEDALPADPSDVDGPSRQRRGDDGTQLDVMVLWTVNAECANSGQSAGCTPTSTTFDNMVALIELAVTETNTACKRPNHRRTGPPVSHPIHSHLTSTRACLPHAAARSNICSLGSPSRAVLYTVLYT